MVDKEDVIEDEEVAVVWLLCELELDGVSLVEEIEELGSALVPEEMEILELFEKGGLRVVESVEVGEMLDVAEGSGVLMAGDAVPACEVLSETVVEAAMEVLVGTLTVAMVFPAESACRCCTTATVWMTSVTAALVSAADCRRWC